mmetsp:Transcript_38342/g.46822  ORF Transcript_38342/g.46822 Transcript_38342/m.46822 type:complete len:200 (+) Transcript_38342:62-661(+)
MRNFGCTIKESPSNSANDGMKYRYKNEDDCVLNKYPLALPSGQILDGVDFCYDSDRGGYEKPHVVQCLHYPCFSSCVDGGSGRSFDSLDTDYYEWSIYSQGDYKRDTDAGSKSRRGNTSSCPIPYLNAYQTEDLAGPDGITSIDTINRRARRQRKIEPNKKRDKSEKNEDPTEMDIWLEIFHSHSLKLCALWYPLWDET